MNLVELYNALSEQGFRLEPEGDNIRVMPFTRVAMELKAAIVEHKQELLLLLISRRRLELEIEAIAQRDFPGTGLPPVLARCIGHYLAGPVIPPAEGIAAWWAGARRAVMKIITREKEFRPPTWAVTKGHSVVSLMIDRGAAGPAVVDSAEWERFCTFVRKFNAESRNP
jgi:hypothetical protein